MNRSDLIRKVIKKSITDKYPMVKDVDIKMGQEKNMTKYYSNHKYLYYFRIHIHYKPGFYSDKLFKTIKNEIYELKPFLFSDNEFIHGVRNLTDYPLNLLIPEE